jgi:hypothetical protein
MQTSANWVDNKCTRWVALPAIAVLNPADATELAKVFVANQQQTDDASMQHIFLPVLKKSIQRAGGDFMKMLRFTRQSPLCAGGADRARTRKKQTREAYGDPKRGLGNI